MLVELRRKVFQPRLDAWDTYILFGVVAEKDIFWNKNEL